MPFLRAGFNARNTDTGIRGWTRPVSGNRGFALAELRRFACGDHFWLGVRKPSFLAWGEQVMLGTWPSFSLPSAWQHGLPQSRLP